MLSFGPWLFSMPYLACQIMMVQWKMHTHLMNVCDSNVIEPINT